ncbi:uncharacterized protein V1518DRAFT_382278 [Limtongia smithiae]|uniref:uncharacterized protein n=1 Tax=Limtongia smithiae TaxID=1125753 RepID=UPI0034CD2EBC
MAEPFVPGATHNRRRNPRNQNDDPHSSSSDPQQQSNRKQPQSLRRRFQDTAGSQLTMSFGDNAAAPTHDHDHDHDHGRDHNGDHEKPTASLDLTEYFSSEELATNSLSASILQDIHDGSYECMICISPVTRKSRVWFCRTCYRVFHIYCVQKWARQLKTNAIEQRTTNNSNTFNSASWRCPGCQAARTEVPSQYTCWCGKVENPDQSPLFPPHSCGQTCGHGYDTCPHVCELPCHPGPHPKCSAMGPQIDCFCGKSTSQRKCVDTEYDGWCCGVICGELMACGVHTCPRSCHEGLCGPCKAPIHSSCYCGKEDKDVLCCEALPAKQSFFIDEDNDEASWIGNWKCEHLCGRELDCGKHKCTRPCHPQDLEPGHCKLDPDVVKTCPCGKHTILKILGHERQSCTDEVPTCGDTCEKLLPCGHRCKSICHDGSCGDCVEQVTVPCRCGFNKIILKCVDLVFGAPVCKRVCHITLNCQRHECGQVCCPGEKPGLERVAKFRRKDGRQSQQSIEAYIEPQHICTAICGNLLKCRNHHCQMTCHRGPCQPCLEASFEELTCHCGRTKTMPPVPCGAVPPVCNYQCARPTVCGHPAVQHNCHGDDEDCPRCPYLVERRCMCGKSLMKNQPCSRQNVSCGVICNKLLACGSHRCRKPCHREGECESPCKQPCGMTKQCGHPDEMPCHAPFQCPETKPCSVLVEVRCPCGNLVAKVTCNATKTNKASKRELKCNDQCALIARNARLAEALQIGADSSASSFGGSTLLTASTPDSHTDLSLKMYGTNKRWCESIEQIIDSFVASKTPKRSLAFPPMRRQQRQFIHTLAEAYELESESQDPEPHRSVVLHRNSRTSLPEMSLAQAFVVYSRKLQQQQATSSTGALPLRKVPKQAYNAFLLGSIQVGLTRVDLERKIERMLTDAAVAEIRFQAQWIDDEDVVLTPLPYAATNTLLPKTQEEIERDLVTVKPLIRRLVLITEHLAASVDLCWITRDNLIAYKESTVKVYSALTSGASTPYSSSIYGSQSKFSTYNTFAPLNLVSGEAAAAAVAAAVAASKRERKKQQPQKDEPVAESWEELGNDDEDDEESSGDATTGEVSNIDSSDSSKQDGESPDESPVTDTASRGIPESISGDATVEKIDCLPKADTRDNDKQEESPVVQI